MSGIARWAPVSGILYVVLWIVVIFVVARAIRVTRTRRSSRGTRTRATVTSRSSSFFLVLAASLCFVWFLSVLRGRLAQAEGTAGTKTALAFGAGLVAVTLWTIASAIWMSISFAVDDADEFVVDPNMDRLFGNLGYALWFGGTTIALLVVLCVGLVGLRGQLIPRWLAWVSFVVAVDDARRRSSFIPFLIWLGWVLVVSLVWLFWKPEADAAAPAAPAG